MKKILVQPRTQFQLDQIKAAVSPEKFAIEELDKMRVAYEAGDKRSLALAIQLCGALERVMPEWVVTAFKSGLEAMVEYEATSWDEILGGNPRGKRLLIARKNRRWTRAIVELLEEIPAGPRNDDFFADIAARIRKIPGGVGITGAQAKKLYHALHPSLRFPTGRRRGRSA